MDQQTTLSEQSTSAQSVDQTQLTIQPDQSTDQAGNQARPNANIIWIDKKSLALLRGFNGQTFIQLAPKQYAATDLSSTSTLSLDFNNNTQTTYLSAPSSTTANESPMSIQALSSIANNGQANGQLKTQMKRKTQPNDVPPASSVLVKAPPSKSNSISSSQASSSLNSFCSCSSENCFLTCLANGHSTFDLSTKPTSPKASSLDAQDAATHTQNAPNDDAMKTFSKMTTVVPDPVLSSAGSSYAVGSLSYSYSGQSYASSSYAQSTQDSQSNPNGSYLFNTTIDSFNNTTMSSNGNQSTVDPKLTKFAIPTFPIDVNEEPTIEIDPIDLDTVDAYTIDMVERRMKIQATKAPAKKRSVFQIEDTMALELDEDMSSYGKIAQMFYYLNSKLGHGANNQQFELGVFFGVMINRYPDVMETSGSGADHMRKVFNETRKYFKDILKKQGKLADEEEAKSSAGTDLFDDLNLSANSTASSFQTNETQVASYTAVNAKKQKTTDTRKQAHSLLTD